MQLPGEDQFLLTRGALMDRIRGMLGGRAAEEAVFGEVSIGAQNDLERATALARQIAAMYGMSERLGLAHSRSASADLPQWPGVPNSARLQRAGGSRNG